MVWGGWKGLLLFIRMVHGMSRRGRCIYICICM